MKLFINIFLVLLFSCDPAFALDPPFAIKNAIESIEANFGDKVIVKSKTLLKYGRSEQVHGTTYTTLMDLPAGTYNETYVSTNIITHIVSTNAGDGQVVAVEGHKLVGTDFIFVKQNVTLNGQTKVALDVPMARVSRASNSGTTDFAGNIAIFEDDTTTSGVPDTDSKVHIMVDLGVVNQSHKASTTMSSTDYWIVTQAFASIATKTGSPITELRIEMRTYGGVFKVVAIAAISTSGATSTTVNFDPPIVVPKNADIRMRGLGSANGLDVAGWINGYLATVKN